MRQRKIIWFAIVLSTFIYAGMLAMLSREWPQPGSFDAAVRQQIPMVLYLLGLATFGIAVMFPRLVKSQASWLASLALFESVAIYGLLAAFLARDWRLFIAPWVLALIGFMLRFPSDETAADRGSM